MESAILTRMLFALISVHPKSLANTLTLVLAEPCARDHKSLSFSLSLAHTTPQTHLSLLQYCSVVHVQFARHRLDQPPPLHGDHRKPRPQHLQLLDGPGKVVPALTRGGTPSQSPSLSLSLTLTLPTHSLTSCLVLPLVARTFCLRSWKLISPPFLSLEARQISIICTPSFERERERELAH